MLVCYLTDEPSKIPAIRAVLEPHHRIIPRLLGDKAPFGSEGVLMVDADLRVMARGEQIKEALGELRAVSEKLFVVQRHLHHMVAQAYALGATSVVRSNREIAPKLAEIEAAARASQSDANGAPPGIAGCSKVFVSMFSAIKQDCAINLSDAENVTSQIIANIDRDGLSAWLDNVRRYHQGTFQ